MKMWNTQQTEDKFRDLKLGLEILQNTRRKKILLSFYKITHTWVCKCIYILILGIYKKHSESIQQNVQDTYKENYKRLMRKLRKR